MTPTGVGSAHGHVAASSQECSMLAPSSVRVPRAAERHSFSRKGQWNTVSTTVGAEKLREFMGFHKEPSGYEKTILSDLQGAWENLRSNVVDAHPFSESDRLLLHIDEAMSWESVRDLDKMRAALLLVRNLATRNATEEIVTSANEI